MFRGVHARIGILRAIFSVWRESCLGKMIMFVVIFPMFVIALLVFLLFHVRSHPRFPAWVDIDRAANIPQRQEHQRLWMSAFDEQDRDRVDRLLKTFCRCFLIREKHRYRLRPQDSILEMYARNNRWSMADSMEAETFVRALEDDFGVDFDHTPCLRDPHCTIGDVVRLIATPVSAGEIGSLAHPVVNPAASR